MAKSAHCSCATLSRSVKYTCPAGELRACTTSPSIHRSLNWSPPWMCAARRVTIWPTRRIRSGALEIITRPRVDLDLVAALDEQRHVHAKARLDGRRLRRARRRIALEAEVRVRHRQDDRCRKVDADGRPLVLAEHRGHPVREVVHGIAEQLLVER